MMFGRVEAVATKTEDASMLDLVVYLESGRGLKTVRSEQVGVLRPVLSRDDLIWHADQYAQDTIANELALEGWEVIGAGDLPEADSPGLPRSATYAVRRLSLPEP